VAQIGRGKRNHGHTVKKKKVFSYTPTLSRIPEFLLNEQARLPKEKIVLKRPPE
jgi:hypothetical protein